MEKISRKNFIQNSLHIATSVGILASGIPIYSCGSYSREDVSDKEEKWNSALKNLDYSRTQILNLARYSPSSHNTQPWKIKINNQNEWILQSIKDRWLPMVDPTNRETILSLGAFYETLSQAASDYGFHTDYQILSEDKKSKSIAKIILTEKSNSDQKAINKKAILSRRTLRKEKYSPNLTNALLKKFMDDKMIFFPVKSKEDLYIQESTIEANIVQVGRDDAQRELSNWIRWSNKEAKKYKNGLTPASMEINGFAGWWVRQFYDRESVMSNSFREKTISMVKEDVQNRGGWLIITGGNSVQELFETGRRFQRMSLRGPELLIGIHPMTQVLEEKPWQDTIMNELKTDNPVQFVLRIGKVEKYKKPTSLRMPLIKIVH